MDALVLHTHIEPVMGTLVGISSPEPLAQDGLRAAVAALHKADRVFSTWDPTSPMSRLRSGVTTLDDLEGPDAEDITAVLTRCALARELTGGAFDPWSLPGGVDPTGLVKGWAAGRAMDALEAGGAQVVQVNAGGDIVVRGQPGDGPWRVGIRHPEQPQALCAIVTVEACVATSGNYERPGQLIDPRSGWATSAALSATVTGPDLDLADAFATGLAVGGRSVLEAIDRLEGYEAHLITNAGRHFATPGMAFASA